MHICNLPVDLLAIILLEFEYEPLHLLFTQFLHRAFGTKTITALVAHLVSVKDNNLCTKTWQLRTRTPGKFLYQTIDRFPHVLAQVRKLVARNCLLLKDEEFTALLRAVPNVVHLNLRDNLNLTSAFVRFMMPHTTSNIVHLDLSGCENNTAFSNRFWHERFPQLEYLAIPMSSYSTKGVFDSATVQVVYIPSTDVNCEKFSPKLRALHCKELKYVNQQLPYLQALFYHSLKEATTVNVQPLAQYCKLQLFDIRPTTLRDFSFKHPITVLDGSKVRNSKCPDHIQILNNAMMAKDLVQMKKKSVIYYYMTHFGLELYSVVVEFVKACYPQQHAFAFEMIQEFIGSGEYYTSTTSYSVIELINHHEPRFDKLLKPLMRDSHLMHQRQLTVSHPYHYLTSVHYPVVHFALDEIANMLPFVNDNPSIFIQTIPPVRSLECYSRDSIAKVKFEKLFQQDPCGIQDKLTGKSALADIMSDNDEARFEEALELGVDMNMKSRNNTTPLITAIQTEKIAFVKLLLDHGADINFSHTTMRPIDIACSCNSMDAFNVLVKRGVDLAQPNADGHTPLDAAVALHNTGVVSAICDLKPECIEMENKHGENPIYTAIRHCNGTFIDYIISSKPNDLNRLFVEHKNSHGLNVIDVCKQCLQNSGFMDKVRYTKLFNSIQAAINKM